MTLPKAALKAELTTQLALELDTLERAQHAVQQAATHEEAKPENDKDTRALEQSYLARGQAIRAEALVEQLQLLRTMALPSLRGDSAIQAGALIALEDEQATRCVFLAPYGGGIGLEVDGVMVTVVTPVSALGRALLGRTVGDDIEVRVPSSVRSYSVTAIV